jgi:hypothetical protein
MDTPLDSPLRDEQLRRIRFALSELPDAAGTAEGSMAGSEDCVLLSETAREMRTI